MLPATLLLSTPKGFSLRPDKAQIKDGVMPGMYAVVLNDRTDWQVLHEDGQNERSLGHEGTAGQISSSPMQCLKHRGLYEEFKLSG